MRSLNWALFLLVATVSPLEAQKEKTDQEKLQGEWTIVSARSRHGPLFQGRRVRIAGDQMEFFKPSGESEQVATFQLDPRKAPKEIDLQTEKGGKKRTLLGLYAIEGDRLQLCWSARTGAGRPVDFGKAGGEDDVRVYILQRKKD